MKSAIRKEQGRGHAILNLMCWMLCIMIVLPVVMFAALHLPFVQKMTIARFTGMIEQSTGFRVELSSYNWWPFSGLHVRNITVASMGKRIVECEELRLGYEILFEYPYLQPKELRLQRPAIHIERDPAGRWEIPWDPKERRRDLPGEIPSWLNDMSWPQVYVEDGTIDARQNGSKILSIKGVNGVLPVRRVLGADGPRLEMDLGKWGK